MDEIILGLANLHSESRVKGTPSHSSNWKYPNSPVYRFTLAVNVQISSVQFAWQIPSLDEMAGSKRDVGRRRQKSEEPNRL